MQNQPPHAESSQASPFEYALRQLWGSRAAIGSGGKKARPFCRRKKASTSALRPCVIAIQLHCARHCEPRRQNGQSKPFSRSRRAACFLWYFLSRRKKVRSPLGAAAPPSAPESARQTLIGKRGLAPAGAPKGFPRGKQSARFALPCAPLVVCLNDRSLTAFGGCIHWIPASLRSPLETFGARKLAGFPCRAASPIPRP